MYMYMMIHPGKKLNFMGNEFGQIREWSEAQEQDWMILKYPIHDAFHKYMVKLNDIYKKEKAFHYDYHRENFEWLTAIRKNDVFMRSEEKRQIT